MPIRPSNNSDSEGCGFDSRRVDHYVFPQTAYLCDLRDFCFVLKCSLSAICPLFWIFGYFQRTNVNYAVLLSSLGRKLKALSIASATLACAVWNIWLYTFSVVPLLQCPRAPETVVTSSPAEIIELAAK